MAYSYKKRENEPTNQGNVRKETSYHHAFSLKTKSNNHPNLVFSNVWLWTLFLIHSPLPFHILDFNHWSLYEKSHRSVSNVLALLSTDLFVSSCKQQLLSCFFPSSFCSSSWLLFIMTEKMLYFLFKLLSEQPCMKPCLEGFLSIY